MPSGYSSQGVRRPVCTCPKEGAVGAGRRRGAKGAQVALLLLGKGVALFLGRVCRQPSGVVLRGRAGGFFLNGKGDIVAAASAFQRAGEAELGASGAGLPLA